MDNYPHRLFPREEMFLAYNSENPLRFNYTNWVIREILSAKELLTLSIIAQSSRIFKRGIQWAVSEAYYGMIVKGELLIVYNSIVPSFNSESVRGMGQYIVKYDDVINWLTEGGKYV